ncbi:hypothetical protein DLAC_00956 [Tieghemostelium lacteum]|uniref:CUB domain-containing protein n=1 Tax=Tieghemostelium lacteum TaxID=361077 RepID=A0A152A7D1_TIELA|nr:hypothetical protein DLAC_00956 [Tieghemostelium lacteum]|eukprot:KYR02152.1 hypothetical protein DLAC_00956 [Tieghemostelium lacteum]
MKSLAILFFYLLSIFLVLGNEISAKPVISVSNLSISPNLLSISVLPYGSASIEFTLVNSRYEENPIIGGQLMLEFQDDVYEFNFNNYVSNNGSDITVQLCIPAGSIIQLCGLYPGQSSSRCDLILQVFKQDGTVGTFDSQYFEKNFPGPTQSLTLVQNTQAPSLFSLKVLTNGLTNLLSVEFGIDYYGAGIMDISLLIKNASGDYANYGIGISNKPSTNGFYYYEVLLDVNTLGNTFYFYYLTIVDSESNTLTLLQDQIESYFHIGNFTLQSNFQTPTQLFQIVNYSPTTIPNTVTNTLVQIELTLNAPCTVITNSIYFDCYFLNNATSYPSNIYGYCSVPPYININEIVLNIFAFNNNVQQMDYILLTYAGLNSNLLPSIVNYDYSVNSIDQYKFMFIELNLTIASNVNYFETIFILPLIGALDFSMQSLISGNATYGTYNFIWGYDSATYSLANGSVELLLDNFNYGYNSTALPSLPTTQRVVVNDMSVVIEFQKTTVDLVGNDYDIVPFLITTTSISNDQFIDSSNLYVYWGGNTGGTLEGPSIIPFSSSNLFSSHGVEVYQTYFTMGRSSIDLLRPGSFLIGLQYTSNGHFYQIPLTKQCFNLNTPSVVGTTLTGFDIYPSQVVQTSLTSTVYFNITFKGSQVNALNISYYTTQSYQTYIPQQSTPCLGESFYNPVSQITNFECAWLIPSQPSQIYNLFFEIYINGQWVTYYNGMLLEDGFPSYLKVVGSDSTTTLLSPVLNSFNTSYDLVGNSITLNYNITNPTPYDILNVTFLVINTDYPTNSISYPTTQLAGELVLGVNYMSGFSYYFQNIAIGIRVFYSGGAWFDFPYQILQELDPNHQDLPVSEMQVDYSAPRLVDFGIEGTQTTFSTTGGAISVEFYFDITDDISGFFEAAGTFSSLSFTDTSGSNSLIQDFTLTYNDLQSGNSRNGRYSKSFVIPQYTQGVFEVNLATLTDYATNSRQYSVQNCKILSSGQNNFTVVSQTDDPNPPTFGNAYVSNDQLYISFSSGLVSSVYVQGIDGTVFPATQTSSQLYQTSNQPFIPSFSGVVGQYPFSICYVSQALQSRCVSWLDLWSNNFPYYFTTQ